MIVFQIKILNKYIVPVIKPLWVVRGIYFLDNITCVNGAVIKAIPHLTRYQQLHPVALARLADRGPAFVFCLSCILLR